MARLTDQQLDALAADLNPFSPRDRTIAALLAEVRDSRRIIATVSEFIEFLREQHEDELARQLTVLLHPDES